MRNITNKYGEYILDCELIRHNWFLCFLDSASWNTTLQALREVCHESQTSKTWIRLLQVPSLRHLLHRQNPQGEVPPSSTGEGNQGWTTRFERVSCPEVHQEGSKCSSPHQGISPFANNALPKVCGASKDKRGGESKQVWNGEGQTCGNDLT